MKNIYDINDFLPESEFKGKGLGDLLPEQVSLNEAKGEGTDLDGKPLSDVYVKDWLWDFNLELSSFPKKSKFYTLLEPEKDLSIFTAQVVNTFAVEIWESLKTKKVFSQTISQKEREKIKSKIRGFWGTKKSLDKLKEEKEQLIEFIKELEGFIKSGELGASIQMASDDIILNKAIDPSSGPITKIFTSLKSFFSKESWQRAVAWLINNIAYNEQHVKWLNTTLYSPNKLSNGITPDIKSAFDRFIIDAGLDASFPSMETAMSAIKIAEKITIEKTLVLPEQGKDTWMGALYNTHLFGLYQSLLIIATCAWVYDLVGDTNIMKTLGSPEVKTTSSEYREKDMSGLSSDSDRYSEKDGIKRYRIHYSDQLMKDILDTLVSDNIVGDAIRKEYLEKFSSPNVTKKGILSNIKGYILKAVSDKFTAEQNKLYTKASDHTGANLFIPVDILQKLLY
jgi:hypothetical protein